MPLSVREYLDRERDFADTCKKIDKHLLEYGSYSGEILVKGLAESLLKVYSNLGWECNIIQSSRYNHYGYVRTVLIIKLPGC